jgi:hypothetical protein
MLADLGARGINELHVEAGEKLNASLLKEGGVDELLVYVAPRLLGSGRGLAALGPVRDAGAEPRLSHRRRRPRRRRPAPAAASAALTPSRRCGRLARGDNRPCSPASSAASAASSKRSRSARARLRQGARDRGAAGLSRRRRLGDSIALSGACMTVVRLEPEARPLPRRDLGRKPRQDRRPRRRRRGQPREGDARRRPPRRPSRLRPCRRRRPGHALRAVGESWALEVEAPAALARFLAVKGSVAVDGVSLTVNSVEDRASGCAIGINLIPHTVQNTSLRGLAVGRGSTSRST